jgi:histidine ammonia-lyase
MADVSGGNFHAEPVALAADAMAVAIAEVGAIAERRIAMLIDAGVSRLPPFLTPDAGLNSGFMIVHVTAAALASENKSWPTRPASTACPPAPTRKTMCQHGHLRRAPPAADDRQHRAHPGHRVLAAAQGIEFLRPLTSSPALEGACAAAQRVARDDAGPQPGARHRAAMQPGGGGAVGAPSRTLPGAAALRILA